MNKKFFDIAPLQEKRREQILKPDENRGNGKRFISSKKSSQPKKRAGFFFLLFFIITGFCLYIFLEPKATVEIWPKTDTVSFEKRVIISTNIDHVRFSQNPGGSGIPGILLKEEKDLEREFSTTGETEKESCARGIIRVYNKYNPPKSLTLISGTHFLSDSGKYFYSPTKIFIPAGEIKGSKVVSGWADVEVVAKEPGEDHNIGPAKFSVPKLAGTAYYHTTFAESFLPITGGSKGKTKVVTSEDLEKAEKELTEDMFEITKNLLDGRISSDFILLDKAQSQEIIRSVFSAEPGAAQDSFSLTIKAKAKTLAFRRDDLRCFAEDLLYSQIPENKTFYDGSLKTDFEPVEIDLENEKVILDLKVSVDIYDDLDQGNLKNALREKSSVDAVECLKKLPEISEAQIKCWPFWTRRMPKDTERIQIQLNFFP